MAAQDRPVNRMVNRRINGLAGHPQSRRNLFIRVLTYWFFKALA
jgi:hypothetical protein